MRNKYRIKIFNTINFKKSMHYYPRLLSDDQYKQEVVRIMRTLKEYIISIEGGKAE